MDEVLAAVIQLALGRLDIQLLCFINLTLFIIFFQFPQVHKLMVFVTFNQIILIAKVAKLTDDQEIDTPKYSILEIHQNHNYLTFKYKHE